MDPPRNLYDIEFITDQFSRLTKGTLSTFELFSVNINSVISDIYSDPYTQIELNNETTITHYGRLKLWIIIREPITERDTTITVNLVVKNGLIEHVTDFETTEFDTLPNEADDKKIIDPEKLKQTNDFLLKCINSLISIMNGIISSGNWKIKNKN